MKVYCAGPLFNDKEREEMAEIAQSLESEGFDVFLPQRDGLELAVCVEALVENGLDRHRASQALSRAIFALDVYQVLEACDAIVVNLNGRVPDEGAVAEAAMAWRAGKALVAYKADVRTAFNGYDNPLVAGLFDFKTSSTIDDLVASLKSELEKSPPAVRESDREKETEHWLEFGETIWNIIRRSGDHDELVAALMEGLNITASSPA